MQKQGLVSKAISQHAFGAPQKVKDIVEAANTALDGKYSGLVAKMKLYLTKRTTRDVLLKPITSNIIEAHEQVAALLREHYAANDAGAVPLRSSTQLRDLLSIDVS
jgi:hypothetical protein